MDFSFSDEQELIRESVERFVREAYEPDMRRAIEASDDGFSREHWETFAELGWLGLLLSEDDGGFGGGPIELMILFEAFGRGLVLEPYLATVVLGGGIIANAGNAAQKEAVLPGIVEGKTQLALAYAEPNSRYNLANVSLAAKKSGTGYALNGHKGIVINGPAADQIIVSARTSGGQKDEAGITLFLVNADAKGFSRQNYPTQDGFRASEMVFDNVEVGTDDIIGKLDKGLPILNSAIDQATLAVSAEAVGAMETLYKATVEYSKTRKQFGVPIGQFQVLQHRMTEMFIAHEQTKSLLYRAAMAFAAGDDDAPRSLSALKAEVGRAGRLIGQDAIQIHGGMGMTEEMFVGNFFKRLTMINSLFGNEDFHLRRFAGL